MGLWGGRSDMFYEDTQIDTILTGNVDWNRKARPGVFLKIHTILLHIKGGISPLLDHLILQFGLTYRNRRPVISRGFRVKLATNSRNIK